MRTFLSFREIDYYSKSSLSTKQDAVIKLINGESVIGVGKQYVWDVDVRLNINLCIIRRARFNTYNRRKKSGKVVNQTYIYIQSQSERHERCVVWSSGGRVSNPVV